MVKRKISEGVQLLAAVDWGRRLFDSLIPLPDGTSYNAYLVEGSEKAALIDTVDPTMTGVLGGQLREVPELNYVVAHHGEQDHSGSLPFVLERYPRAKVLVSLKGKEILSDHLHIPEEKFRVVQDGEEVSLGNKTLRFLYTPWVHWPETMVTYLKEEGILFTCDFFGSHFATSDIFAREEQVLEPAKRYFAEIMMPFRAAIEKNLEKIRGLSLEIIAPSHGPLWKNPSFILEHYQKWVSAPPENLVVLPYVSMHGSTRLMVDYLSDELIKRNVRVAHFELPSSDLGKIAISLVDAATVVLGTPTVHAGAHPYALFIASLANALRPKLKYATIIGSYGWGGKTVEQITQALGNLKVEVLPPVLAKGLPRETDFRALEKLAEEIASRHEGLKEE